MATTTTRRARKRAIPDPLEVCASAAGLARGGQFAAARSMLEDAILALGKRGAKIGDLHGVLGDTCLDVGEHDLAIEHYKEALAAHSSAREALGEAQAHRRLGTAYQAKGDLDRANDLYDEAESHLRQIPAGAAAVEWPLLHLARGSLAEARGTYGKALDHYRRALALVDANPTQQEALVLCLRHLGSAERENGTLDEASEHLTRALGILQARGENDKLESIELHNLLGAVLEDQGRLDLALGHYHIAYEMAEALDYELAKAETLRRIGSACAHSGEFKDAIGYLTEAIKLATQIGNDVVLSDLFGDIGDVALSCGDVDEAIEHYKQGLALDQAHQDPLGQARAHRRLGRAYQEKGDFDRAGDEYDEAEGFLRQIDDAGEWAVLYTGMGCLYEEKGLTSKARDHYHKALEINEAQANQPGVAICLRHLGSVSYQAGDLELASEHLNRALGILKSALNGDDKPQVIEVLNLLGAVLESQGRADLALNRYRDAYDIAKALDHPPGEADSLQRMASAYAHRGQFKLSLENLAQAIDICCELGDTVSLAGLYGDLGDIHEELGDLDEAIERYKQALALDQAHQDLVGQARAHRRLGSAYMDKGDLDRAGDAFDDAESLLRQIEDDGEWAKLLTARGSLAERAGKHGKALDHYKKALDLNDRKGNSPGVSVCLRYEGSAYRELGDLNAANDTLNRALGILQSLGDEDKPELIRIHNLLGAVSEDQGRLDAALTRYRSAYDLADGLDHQPGRAQSLLCMGRLQAALGLANDAKNYLVREAERNLKEALSLFDSLGHRGAVGESHLELGSFYEQLHNDDLAYQSFGEADRIAVELSSPVLRGRALLGMGRLCLEAGDLRQAKRMLEDAERSLGGMEKPSLVADLHIEIGRLQDRAGQPSKAYTSYRAALALLTPLGQLPRIARCQRLLRDAALRMDDPEKAWEHQREAWSLNGTGEVAPWVVLLNDFHPALRAQAVPAFRAGDYESAISKAFRTCEAVIVERATVHKLETRGDVGERWKDGPNLRECIRYWFSAEVRGIAPWQYERELEGFRDFCYGAFASQHNPTKHHAFPTEVSAAFAWLAVAHIILASIDAPAPTAGDAASTVVLRPEAQSTLPKW